MLVFGLKETSDSWVDALKIWWQTGCTRFAQITRVVIYLDNGPHNNGRRTQFLKRMVEFADWSGLEIRLLYYPPYHSKYNPVACAEPVEANAAGQPLRTSGVAFCSTAPVLCWTAPSE